MLRKPSQHTSTTQQSPTYAPHDSISEPKAAVVVVEEEIRLPTSGFDKAPVFHVRANVVLVAHIMSGCGLTAIHFQSAVNFLGFRRGNALHVSFILNTCSFVLMRHNLAVTPAHVIWRGET